MLVIPMFRSVWVVTLPQSGILETDNGAKKTFSCPWKICNCPAGLASLVAIFETVLLPDSPKLMLKPVSLVTLDRNSLTNFHAPK